MVSRASAFEAGREAVSAVQVELPRDRSCATHARRWLERHMPEAAESQVVDDLKLVATELVENALVHGRGRIVLRLETRTDSMRVEVTDEGENAAIKIREQGLELGGWGLVLVDRISNSWGAFEGTTHVWAELPVVP
jgi:anti-sigma regulatory factor (Ser/Thr protein kinase)